MIERPLLMLPPSGTYLLSQLPAERAVQQRLKQMLRLPFRFPLLRAQTLKLLDDARRVLTAERDL